MMSTCASTLACTAAEGGTGDPLVRMCQSTDSAPGLQVRVPLLHCMLCAIVMRGCLRSYLLPAMSGRGGCRTCIAQLVAAAHAPKQLMEAYDKQLLCYNDVPVQPVACPSHLLALSADACSSLSAGPLAAVRSATCDLLSMLACCPG